MKDIKFLFWEKDSEFTYCSGKLHLLVDGNEWVSNGMHCLNHSFGCWIDMDGEEHFEDGYWALNDGYFDDFNEEEKKVILDLVNENMERSCCGGCL